MPCALCGSVGHSRSMCPWRSRSGLLPLEAGAAGRFGMWWQTAPKPKPAKLSPASEKPPFTPPLSKPHDAWKPRRKQPAMLAPKPRRPALLLLPLLVLLTACETAPKPPPVPAAIPLLPGEARQTDSPTFSQQLQTKLAEWQRLLTGPSSQGSPVKPVITD